LTFAVLGALAKYPIGSNVLSKDQYIGNNKFGFFETEEDHFSEIASTGGLIRRPEGAPYWCRHPLAFLVEAADDICYAIIDIEDGFELGYLKFEEAQEVLLPIAPNAQLPSSMAPSEKIGKIRAVAIGNLIKECVSVFVENESDLLTGSFQTSLIKLTKYKDYIDIAKKRGREKVYNADRTIKLEIAGVR
jgi:dGTPase